MFSFCMFPLGKITYFTVTGSLEYILSPGNSTIDPGILFISDEIELMPLKTLLWRYKMVLTLEIKMIMRIKLEIIPDIAFFYTFF